MNKNRKYNLKYPWRKTISNIQRCTNPKNDNYHRYGGRGIKCLITAEDLKQLWFRDLAFEMEKPSIDREDNDGDYTFDNCRFIEMNENVAKDKYIPILQYDLEGNFIREWSSQKEASIILNIRRNTINNCLRKVSKQGHGYLWLYKNDEDACEKIKPIINNQLKPVIQHDLDGNFINEYKSIIEAERQTKIRNTNICACVKGKTRTAGGFIWKYKEMNNG